MAEYSNTSPYRNTPQNSITLGIWEPRFFPAQEDDIYYEIDTWYDKRPDLLSADLYGTPKLWWCFAQRNPDQIEDPIYDFKPGVQIQLPKPANIKDVFTCALFVSFIKSSDLMNSDFISIGNFPLFDINDAPIDSKGSIILFIGLFIREQSPVNFAEIN